MGTLTSLTQEACQAHHAALQVRLVEGVGDVPSDGPKLAALLHNSMEEAEGEQQLLPSSGLAGAGVAVGPRGHVGVGAPYVGLHPLWGLRGQLDAGLQD